MKLLLANPRGFCAGVRRAIDTVVRALELWGSPVYVRHEIVHNQHVIEDLRRRGAVFVDDLKEVPVGARVIYSAHGIPPWVRDEAKERCLQEIDATCGLVTKVHSAVKRFAEKGYHVLLIGHRHHVEMLGTAGEAPAATTVIESVGDVAALSFTEGQKLAYLTQTTLSVDDVKEIVSALVLRYPRIETLPSSSICYATMNRQMALCTIAHRADLVLVVGDPKSSNSNRLREVAMRRGIPAFLINGKDEIQPAWLRHPHSSEDVPISVIAMTAGASTPESVVQDCIDRLRTLGVTDVEEVTCYEENVFFALPRQVFPT